MRTPGWHEATHADRGELNQFVCTDPPKATFDRHRGKHHPKPWELEVQSHIRNMRPPVTGGEWMMTLRDEIGISAAAHFGFDAKEQQFLIWAVARATRCAGQNHGSMTLEFILGLLRSVRRSMNIDCGAFGWVHPENHHCKRMLEQVGFEHVGNEGGYEGWVHDLAI